LLKLTGKAFLDKSNTLCSKLIKSLAQQISKLKKTCQFGIVVGGGNILRGEEQGLQMGLTPAFGHQAGMLATMINGLILQDIFQQEDVKTSLLSALFCPQICPIISQQNILEALNNETVIIFAGGTGVPFFTTDTNAVARCLQMGAKEVWKATGADGVYTADPKKDPDATLLKKVKYFDAIDKKLGIIDTTAIALAEKHKVKIRVFNIFSEDALLKASEDEGFGSLIN